MGTMNGENSTVHGPVDREAVTASRIDSQLNNGVSHETTATRTVTFHMTVNTDRWSGTYGLDPADVPDHVTEWLDNLTHSLGGLLPSDGKIDAVPARREHVELSDNELRAFLRELTRDPDSVRTLRFEFRRDGVAVKVNEDMWLTVGHTIASD